MDTAASSHKAPAGGVSDAAGGSDGVEAPAVAVPVLAGAPAGTGAEAGGLEPPSAKPEEFSARGRVQATLASLPDTSWPRPGSRFERVETWLVNNWAMATAVFLYGCMLTTAFASGAMLEIAEHYPDIRAWAVPLGRGCGYTLDINCALLVLPMSKEAMLYLRTTWLSAYLPVDNHMTVHRVVAWLIVVATVIHGSMQAVNYALYLELTSGIDGYTQVLVTGLTATACLAAIVFTARRSVRRSGKFPVFWRTHQLYWVFYGCLFLHGMRKGTFSFWWYGCGPVGIFVLGRLWRSLNAVSHRGKLLDGEAREGDVTHLRLPRPVPFKAGQYFDIRVPHISAHEYHPFTASSPPDADELTFDIKALGDWTSALHKAAKNGELAGKSCWVRGPFGAPAEVADQFDHVILVASGIGATPFVAWLKHLVSRRAARRATIASGAEAGGDTAAAAAAAAADVAHLSTIPSESEGESSAGGAPARPGDSYAALHASLLAHDHEPSAHTPAESAARSDSSVAREEKVLEAELAWPYSGPCGCFPLRTAFADPVSGRAVPAHVALGVAAWIVSLQRIARSVTLNTAALWVMILSTCLDVLTLSANTERLWAPDVRDATEAVSQACTISVIALLHWAPMADLWCLGFHNAWRGYKAGREAVDAAEAAAAAAAAAGPNGNPNKHRSLELARQAGRATCVVREILIMSPLLVAVIVIELMFGRRGPSAVMVHPYVHMWLVTAAKALVLVPLVVRFRHTARAWSGVQHRTHDINRINAVKFVWVNRHLDDSGWLVPELAALEATDTALAHEGPLDASGRVLQGVARCGTHFIEVFTYVTRRGRGDAARSMHEESALMHLRHGITYCRPDWAELLEAYAQGFPVGGHVGVFFCGSPALAQALRRHCVDRTRRRAEAGMRRLRWTFKQEVF